MFLFYFVLGCLMCFFVWVFVLRAGPAVKRGQQISLSSSQSRYAKNMRRFHLALLFLFKKIAINTLQYGPLVNINQCIN